MVEFDRVHGRSAVYRARDFNRYTEVQALPSKAKSKFSTEEDVSYNDLRSKLVNVGEDVYIIVGEVGS